MVALLDQVWEVVDATSKAVPVRVMMVVVVVWAGGAEDEPLPRR